MKHVFTDPQALLAELSKEMLVAMQEVDAKGKAKAKENAESFYSQGSPVLYDRTGKYGDASDSTGARGGGGHVSTEIYMNPSGHGYTTGTFSAQEVWEAAESGSAGVLGMPGRWTKTEQDVEQLANEIFAKHFR